MNILICGGNGFIGRHLGAALASAGHSVIRGVRRTGEPSEMAIDFVRDLRAEDWLPRLKGIDIVINAVGILGEASGVSFEAVHRQVPIALFKACEQAGIKRVFQISALGGEGGQPLTPYMRTKREADAYLMASSLDWIILRPSLVVGADGASSHLFRILASLPLVGLPGSGEQQLQPVHIDDLCQLLVRMIEPDIPTRCIVDVVGPAPITYRAMLTAYRSAMALAAPIWLPVPMWLMYWAARLAGLFSQRVFTADTLRMLEQGNVGDVTAMTKILGRSPIGPAQWFAGIAPDLLRWQAIARWMMPMFQLVLALIWIVTGVLSLGLYPVSESLTMLQQVGLQGWMATTALYGAALLDCALGIATLMAPGRLLWRMQFILILGYTIIITLFLPYYWLHPFGPVLKNLAILALLVVLDAAQTR